MDVIEIRDLDAARRYVVEGLWLQRAVRPTAATTKTVLEWALEIASSGHPLPPTGFVADVGHVALGADSEHRSAEPAPVPGWPPALGRTYEDHVLGKLYADWAFERAGDALRRYADADRPRGVAFVVRQFRDRGGIGGVDLSPAVIRTLLAANPDDVLSQAWDALMRDGPLPILVTMVEGLVSAARRMAEVLGPEDVLALEQRTALADMGEYVAHRQLLQATARLEAGLPARPVRPLVGRREVPTRILDEDQYPVGGYTSISTKGSIESLLQSQLAYIEEADERPDLFDLKFVRDELFYYSRDENQFLRRRRSFVFVLRPDLAAARFKDVELPYQRVVLALSAVVALVRKLTDWLSTDAIRFELLPVDEAGGVKGLADEAHLLGLLLREWVERGGAVVRWLPDRAAAEAEVRMLARGSQTHALVVGSTPSPFEADGAVVTHLVVDGPRPAIDVGSGVAERMAVDDAFEAWQEAVLRVLQLWV